VKQAQAGCVWARVHIDKFLLMGLLDLVEIPMAQIVRRQGISWSNVEHAAVFSARHGRAKIP
jgi:hypothetical protein